MMKSILNVSVLAMVSVLGVNAVHAAEVVPAVTKGDLYDSSTWKDGQKPGSTDPVKITGWGNEYTLSQDMSIGSMRLDAGNVTFDFTDGNHTLTLTTPVSPYGSQTLFRYTEFGSNANWTKLRGGIWECGSKNFDVVNLGFGGPYTFIMTNGCQLANVNNSYLFRRISNSRIYVTDKSMITATNLDFGNGNVGTNDVIEISGGSTVTLSGNFIGQSASEYFCSNKLIVKGSGTSMTCNFLNLGSDGYGGFGVVVAGGATVTPSYPTFSKNAENCFIEVTDGATFAPGCFDWNGVHCYTLISNATLNIRWPRFSIGADGGHDNRLTLAGASTSFTNPIWDTDFMGKDSFGNTFELTAGFKLTKSQSMKLATTSNNVIRIAGNGTEWNEAGFTTSSGRYLFNFAETNALDNTLEIVDGGKMAVNGLWTYGTASKIVVSNGTLSVGGYTVSGADYGLWLGRGNMASGCSLVIQGASPKVESIVIDPNADNQPLILSGNSILRYEIPENGYPENYVPVSLTGLSPSSGTLEIECSTWAAVKGQPRTEIVLFRSSVTYPDYVRTWFNKQTLNLPGNVWCVMRDKDIVLIRRGNQGLSVIVR